MVAFVSLTTGNDDVDGGGRYNQSRPTFKPTPSNVSVSLGQTAVLRCSVDNLGDKTVTWRRLGALHPMTIGSSTFVSDGRVMVEPVHRDSAWNLIITDVRHDDEGTYQCQVNTKDDQSNFYNIYLHIKSIRVTGSEYVPRGGPIQLVCNVTAPREPPIDVAWYKDGRRVVSDAQSGLIVTKKTDRSTLVSVLAVRQSKMTDAGQYSCRSSDNDVASVAVHVFAAPVGKRGTAVAKMWSSSDAKRLSSADTSTSTPHVAGAVIAALHRARDRLLLVLLLLMTMMLTSS